MPFEGTDLPTAVVTGNPVRPEILAVADDRDAPRRGLGPSSASTRTARVVAVFAGSLGATSINGRRPASGERWADRSTT